MRYPKLALSAAVPLLLSCTAMGAWLYDDPSFSLRAVNLRSAPAPGADSVDLIFVGCNRNDYDLSTRRLLTRLALDGRMIGEAGREQPLFLGTRDSSQFTVTMALLDMAFSRVDRVARFELTLQSSMDTPIGARQVDVRLRGRVQRHGDVLAFQGEAGQYCRPGLSQLPPAFDRRPTQPPPPPPRNGPGLRPDWGNPPIP